MDRVHAVSREELARWDTLAHRVLPPVSNQAAGQWIFHVRNALRRLPDGRPRPTGTAQASPDEAATLRRAFTSPFTTAIPSELWERTWQGERWTWDQGRWQFVCWSPTGQSRPDASLLHRAARRVGSLWRLVAGGGDPLCVLHLHLDIPRQWCPATPPTPPGPTEVNGGMVMPCSLEHPIYSWRMEEMAKVWCHEALHRSCMDAPFASRSVCLRHGCRGSLREAWCETWATLWDLGHAILDGHGSQCPLATVLDCLARERIFSLRQAALLYPLLESERTEAETTHTTAYFLLRAVFLFRLDAFWRLSPRPDQHLHSDDVEKLQLLAEETLASPAFLGALAQLRLDAPAAPCVDLRMTARKRDLP